MSQLKFKQIAWGILINSDYPDFILDIVAVKWDKDVYL